MPMVQCNMTFVRRSSASLAYVRQGAGLRALKKQWLPRTGTSAIYRMSPDRTDANRQVSAAVMMTVNVAAMPLTRNANHSLA